MKKIDQTLINLATILISGAGVFTALTKFNLPEINMSFWGENPFAVKRDIIENVTVWLFSLLALLGLLLQVFKEIYLERIPERLHKVRDYYLAFILGFLMMCIVVWILTCVGHAIAKPQWLPKIIQSQKEIFEQARFIVENDGWRKDQLELKDRLDDRQKYIDANYESFDRDILQIEKLLEIKKPPAGRKEKIKNLEKYFKEAVKAK